MTEDSRLTQDDKKDSEHIGKKLDKLIIGAVIGGAIGSVLGLTMAPQEGKKTRKAISEKTKEFIGDHEKEIKTAKTLAKETTVGVFKLLRNSLRKK